MKATPQNSIEYYTYIHGRQPSEKEKEMLTEMDKCTLTAIRDLTSSDSPGNFRIVLNDAINEYILSDMFRSMNKQDQREDLFRLNCLKEFVEKIKTYNPYYNERL
ncbi:MAG: hypothetical protein WDN75_21720 [Bacteroidota bacterium]